MERQSSIQIPQMVQLDHQGISDAIFEKHLKRWICFQLPIVTIILRNNDITSVGIVSFTMNKWTHLAYLNMQSNRIGPNGCKYLSKASFPSLKTLKLNRNKIGDNGVFHLCKASLQSLEVLQIESNCLTGESFYGLNRNSWKTLKKVSIWYNQYRLTLLVRFLALLTTKPRFFVLLDKFNVEKSAQMSLVRKVVDERIVHSCL